MNATEVKIWNEVRDYLMIAVGMVSYSIGWNIFLLPNSITTGGVPGIASVLFWGTGIPVQMSYFGINAVLLMFALKILGFKFSIKTIYAVIVLTSVTTLMQKQVGDTQLLHDQPFMASIIGAIFCGSGVGLGFSFHGSTGGTDIVAAIVNKYHNISLGRVLIFVDLIIIGSTIPIFGDWRKVVFGLATMVIENYVLDRVMNARRESVQFMIFSKKYQEIANAIGMQMDHGVTILDGHGWYTGNEMKVLCILAKKNESVTIFRIVKIIDPNAFVSQSSVIGVYGEGFDEMKVKIKDKDIKTIKS